MIHRVSANQPSFHTVELTAGLNVILADRTETSTQKDTRNGLGKSTLIEIIDFCLGSRPKKGEGLIIDDLKDWAFTIDVTIANNRVQVTRRVDEPNRILIEGNTMGWSEQPDTDDDSGGHFYTADRWRDLLGRELFGIPGKIATSKYQPRFRSLFSYFVRRGSYAYANPFHHTRQQQSWDEQIHIAYLLGLGWENSAKWQELNDQQKAIKAIDSAVKSGAMEGLLGSIGEMEADLVSLEAQDLRESEALKSFRVLPQYQDMQREADEKTATIHQFSNDNIADRRRLARCQESVAGETPPSDGLIEQLYEEAGVVLADSVRRTLAEAKDFHNKVVENRRSFLKTEMERLERRIKEREQAIESLTESRAKAMQLLSTHGALEEYSKLQERHVETRERAERLRTRISDLKNLTVRKRELKVKKAELATVAEQDHEQRRENWTVPMQLFNENSQALYKAPGKLVIDISETGFKFDVEISRKGSEGISKMKVFCFDLTLLELMAQKGGRVDFLVHDSILYDGVDERQRALALERAQEVTEQIGCQYICTLNSDMVPRNEFSGGFDFDSHVRLTLTDKKPADSLLGFQFEQPSK